MRPYWRKIAWNLEDGHLRIAARFLVHQFSETYHEWRLGTDTDKWIAADKLGLGESDQNHYDATDFHGFQKVLKRLRPDPAAHVLFEPGCGMGRAVVVAAVFPFRRVIGVEFSPMLADIARQNVARARRHLRCKDVTIAQGDATTYAIPADVTHAYCYIRGELLAKVLANLKVSAKTVARPLTIIVKNPSCLEAVGGRLDWATHLWDSPSRYGGDYAIFEAAP